MTILEHLYYENEVDLKLWFGDGIIKLMVLSEKHFGRNFEQRKQLEVVLKTVCDILNSKHHGFDIGDGYYYDNVI